MLTAVRRFILSQANRGRVVVSALAPVSEVARHTGLVQQALTVVQPGQLRDLTVRGDLGTLGHDAVDLGPILDYTRADLVRSVVAYLRHRGHWEDAARDLGTLLARRGITLVYGGGRVGLMGAVADGALDAGGRVVGVIPQSLVDRELAHTGVTELRVTSSMHERKALMASLADGFVALPGGAGTLDELFEAWTWTMLGIHLKPCAVLDVGSFYAGLRTHVSRMTSEGFIRPEHAQGLIFATAGTELLGAMARWRAPVPKWTTKPPTP